MERITIAGAGLAGALMALYLAKRGYPVELFESRADPRHTVADPGRSINLALSCRGLTGLLGAGLAERVRPILVPMRARAIHDVDGTVHFQPFGRHPGEHINAVQRRDLNSLLLEVLDETPGVTMAFQTRLVEVDFAKRMLTFQNPDGSYKTHPYTRLIGADGAASCVRDAMVKAGLAEAVREYFPYSYKELSISAADASGFVREHLHLWPRDAFLLLGNPNLDNSITGTLFLPDTGPNSFEALDSPARLEAFFQAMFPDAVPAMPNLAGEFFEHPTGRMSTVKCAPWHYRDECLLIGDSAHGIIPFFGQGMNCAFEDCRIFAELLGQHADDWSKAIPDFCKVRKPDTEAVSRMSLDNYHEIHHDIQDPKFALRKKVELELMHRYPEIYVSRHVQVMFTNTPYSRALVCGEIQKQFIEALCRDVDDIRAIPWESVEKKLPEYVNKLTERGGN